MENNIAAAINSKMGFVCLCEYVSVCVREREREYVCVVGRERVSRGVQLCPYCMHACAQKIYKLGNPTSLT